MKNSETFQMPAIWYMYVRTYVRILFQWLTLYESFLESNTNQTNYGKKKAFGG